MSEETFLQHSVTRTTNYVSEYRCTTLRNASLFTRQVTLVTFLHKELVTQDQKKRENRSSYLRMKSLLEQKDLIIRLADKGGSIVVMDKSKYVNEIYNILNDRDTYSISQK